MIWSAPGFGEQRRRAVTWAGSESRHGGRGSDSRTFVLVRSSLARFASGSDSGVNERGVDDVRPAGWVAMRGRRAGGGRRSLAGAQSEVTPGCPNSQVPSEARACSTRPPDKGPRASQPPAGPMSPRPAWPAKPKRPAARPRRPAEPKRCPVHGLKKEPPRPGHGPCRRGGRSRETLLWASVWMEAPGVEPGSESHQVGPLRA